MQLRFLPLLLLVVACQLTGEARAQNRSRLPPSGSVPPRLFATGLAPAETLAFDRQDSAYLANYRRQGTIGRILADGTAAIVCDLGELLPLEDRMPRVTGLRIDVEGRLIAADSGGGRLLRIAADGSRVEVLADRYEGERFAAIQGVALDRAGNFYFTDSGLDPDDPDAIQQPSGALYRYDIQTNKVTLLDSGLLLPSGLAVAPDQQRLCVAESGRNQLLLYELSPEGEAGNRRVLVNFTPPPSEDEDNDEPAEEESAVDESGEVDLGEIDTGDGEPGGAPLVNDPSDEGGPPNEASRQGDPGAIESDANDAGDSDSIERDLGASEDGDGENGLSNRVFESLLPRGMVFDEAGRLYVTLAAAGQIAVVDLNSGEVIRHYDAGGPGATDCHFHDGDLFTTITEKEAVFRLHLSTAGFDYSGQ